MQEKYNVFFTIQKGINILNLFKKYNKLSFTDIQKDLKYNKLFLKHIRERNGEKAEIVMADHFDTLDEMIRKKH